MSAAPTLIQKQPAPEDFCKHCLNPDHKCVCPLVKCHTPDCRTRATGRNERTQEPECPTCWAKRMRERKGVYGQL